MLRLYIGILIPLSILIPLAAGLYQYRFLSPPAKSIFIYLVLSGCTNTIAIVLAKNGINNLPLLHLYTGIEFITLALFYRQVLSQKIARVIYPFLVVAFAAFCIVNAVFFQNIFSFNTYPRALGALLLIIFALFLFYNLLSLEQDSPWHKNPLTWFNMGLLLYFSGSLSLFLLSQVLLKNKYLNQVAWIIHATLVLLMYILFAAGFFRCKKTGRGTLFRDQAYEKKSFASP